MRVEEARIVTTKERKAFVKRSEGGNVSVKGGDEERNLKGEIRGRVVR